MKARFLSFAVALLALSTCRGTVFAQASGPTSERRARTKPAASKFSAHDLNGLWMTVSGAKGGPQVVDPNAHPPFTAWGQMRFDASFPSLGPRDVAGKENDPILRCDPDGFPKMLGSPHPFEMITLPDRMLQTFEKSHNWRQIWTDGRKLPQDPDPTWNGYSLGRWEGDTFVVESIGFNDITWLDYYGDPHSDAMHLTEYYKRVDHDTLSISVTIDDPKAYTATWVGKPHLFALKPNWEIREYFCVIDDMSQYDKDVRFPSATPNGSGNTENPTPKNDKQ
jgi:hypothetical protein